MENCEMKYPNGKLILPESGVDGIFEKIIVEFENFGDMFQVERIELIGVSCVVKLVEGLEVLLKFPVEKLQKAFFDSLGFIILVSDAFQIQFHKFKFSNIILCPDDIYKSVDADGNVEFRIISKVKGPTNYYFTYYDEDLGEERTKCMTGLVDYGELLKLKEELDEEKFELHMKKVTTMCERMIRDGKKLILKMGSLGC